MTFIATNGMLGTVDLSIVDPAGPGYQNLVAGTGSGRMNFYNQVVDGYDPNLGGGEFVYAKFSGTIAAGTVCDFSDAISGGAIVTSAAAWGGTANSGKPLGVAVSSGVAGQWGWFQVGGLAITTVSGAPAAGNPAYWQASGVVSPTAVAGKQVLGAQFATGVSQTIGQGNAAVALSATQAVVRLQRPVVQSQIT